MLSGLGRSSFAMYLETLKLTRFYTDGGKEVSSKSVISGFF